MKSFGMKIECVIRHNYIPILIFLLMLFRPQIMFWIRHEITRPLQNYFGSSCVRSESGDDIKVVKAGFVHSEDSDDEGCGEDGSCSSDDSGENDDSGEDYSDDEGCNDDGSCDNGDDSYYSEEDTSNEDDGCSCSGETVVTSSEADNSYYYNGTLQIKLTITSTNHYYRLFITDPAGRVAVTLFNKTSFGRGVYYFSWDRNYGNDEYAAAGYYKVVLETEYAPFVRREQSFYFSSVHGFQVNGTSSNVVEIVQ